MIEVVTILISAGDGEHARAQDVGDAVADERRVTGIGDDDASMLAMPSEVSMAASSMTPTPPSKAAVIFLRCTDGSENGSGVSSTMAGVAASDSAGVGVDNQISAADQSRYIRQRIPDLRRIMRAKHPPTVQEGGGSGGSDRQRLRAEPIAEAAQKHSLKGLMRTATTHAWFIRLAWRAVIGGPYF